MISCVIITQLLANSHRQNLRLVLGSILADVRLGGEANKPSAERLCRFLTSGKLIARKVYYAYPFIDCQ